MGVLMCSTGQHVLFISIGRPEDFRSYTCDCPPLEIDAHSSTRGNVTPRVDDPAPGYDFIRRKRKRK